MTTADDIAVRLGLQPFDEFARAARLRHPTQRHGSTTRAVCEALAIAADGEAVAFVTADEGHAGHARAWIDQCVADLGIDAALIRTASVRGGAREFHGRREWYVIDRFVYHWDNLRDASTREALDVIVYQSMMRRCAAVVAPRRKSANPPASSSA